MSKENRSKFPGLEGREDPKNNAAKARAADRAARDPEQQLQVLDDRLGAGIGAKKERQRLSLQIDARKKSEREEKKARQKAEYENKKEKEA